MESDKTRDAFTRSTCIDHTTTNRDILKKHLCSTDDLLELWDGVVSFTFNPFMKRTGYIITEKSLATRWSIAPFHKPYICRATRYGVFCSKWLIKRYQLSITSLPNDVDFTKPCNSTTNNLKLASNTAKIHVYTAGHYFPTTSMNFAASNLSSLLYFVAPQATAILTQLNALGYPKNFLQIQKTVYSEDCKRLIYTIDHKCYSRITIFTNEKIFLNSSTRKDNPQQPNLQQGTEYRRQFQYINLKLMTIIGKLLKTKNTKINTARYLNDFKLHNKKMKPGKTFPNNQIYNKGLQFPYISYANEIPPNTEIHIRPYPQLEKERTN